MNKEKFFFALILLPKNADANSIWEVIHTKFLHWLVQKKILKMWLQSLIWKKTINSYLEVHHKTQQTENKQDVRNLKCKKRGDKPYFYGLSP